MSLLIAAGMPTLIFWRRSLPWPSMPLVTGDDDSTNLAEAVLKSLAFLTQGSGWFKDRSTLDNGLSL